MNYHLDIRTLAFSSSIVSFILCVCMVYMGRTRKTYSGFNLWTISTILSCLAFVLLGLRGLLPDFITVVIANTLIVAAIGIMVCGIEGFVDKKRSAWSVLFLSIFLFISFVYFTYYTPNINARIVVISAVLAVLYGYGTYIVHHYIPKLLGGQNIFLKVVFSFLSIWSIFRIIPTLFFENPIHDFMHASAVHGVSFVVSFSGNIMVTIGLIVLNFQRVEADLFSSLEEVKTLRGILPICMYCKGIRDDKGYWNQIEKYISEHSEAQFSHSICETCMNKYHKD